MLGRTVSQFPGRDNVTLHNSLTISEVPIPVSDGTTDNRVWGVVTWVDVDPRIDYYILYVQGLTNAYQYEDPDGAYKKGDLPGSGRKIVRKTLQLNFWRPGDTVDPSEEEIRYGCRIDADAAWAEIQQALRLGTRDALLHYHAGMIALARGHGEQARSHLETALEINPLFSILHAGTAREALAALDRTPASPSAP